MKAQQYFTSRSAATINRQSVKLNTVNVIETYNGVPHSLHSFADNPQGNKQAERLFRKFIVTYNNANFSLPLSAKNIAHSLDDGFWSANNYTVFLTHSI